MKKSATEILSEIIFYSKYANYLPEFNRRETYQEAVVRNKNMHIEKYKDYKNFSELLPFLNKAYELVSQKKILPSMRSMQFGGTPILKKNTRMFNCAYTAIDDRKVFSEIMFLLLCGCGCGYSVRRKHIANLPSVKAPVEEVSTFVIEDTIEGWADAVNVLLSSYFDGSNYIKFDYSQIRPEGSLVGKNWKAPGPEPLRNSLETIRKMLDAILMEAQTLEVTLEPIHVHDIVCILSNAVLAGGVRRSALIVLFDKDDWTMAKCKYWDIIGDNQHRYRANNSAAVHRGNVTESEFMELLNAAEESMSGEPGIFLTNAEDHGTNPCFPSDTYITTTEGIKQIKDLIGVQFTALVDGVPYQSCSRGFYQTGKNRNDIVTLHTKEGFEVSATSNHLFKTFGGSWVKLGDLKEGDKIVINSHSNRLLDTLSQSNFEKGWLAGMVYGDGTFTDNSACVCTWGDQVEELHERIATFLKNNFKCQEDLGCGNSTYKDRRRVTSTELKTYLEEIGIFPNKVVNYTSLLKLDTSTQIGFLQGWFDADGSVQGSFAKGRSIRLSCVDYKMLQTAQKMLLNLGIFSKIYSRRPAGEYLLPDGNGGLKSYHCQTTYELIISKASMYRYEKVIGFTGTKKREKLDELLTQKTREAYRDNFYATVVGITQAEVQDVYDCTIPELGAFDANGFYVHNCCEISLKNKQFCNLTTINLATVVSQKDFEERAFYAAVLGTLQAGYTDFNYISETWKQNCDEEALLGVSMTGICGADWKSLDYEKAAKATKKANSIISELIEINPAARITCVKPEGTASLLLGCSSGVHAYHSKWYIRNVRFGRNESIAKYLMDVLPNFCQPSKEVGKEEKEIVFSLPIFAGEGATTRESESALDVLERVKHLSMTWVATGHRTGIDSHNISCTINVKQDEWPAVKSWMWYNRDVYNGISVFPYDGGVYVQAPFVEMTEELYNEMTKQLENVSFDIRDVQETEITVDLRGEQACAGGACEI